MAPKSADLTPGTVVRCAGAVVTLKARKQPSDDHHGLNYRAGWWIEGDGGYADEVLDSHEFEVVAVPQSSAAGKGDTASCGHPNPVWWTDSQLWNEVMNGGDRDEEATGILCPSCFADRADDYFDGSRWRITGWRLVPDWGRP